MITSFRWGPELTPKVIQRLIIIIACTAIFAKLTEPLFTQIFAISPLQTWLGLSWFGIEHFLIWQPFTYVFLMNGGEGVNFSFLLSLAIDMYLLWILGTDIYNAVGEKSFLQFYFLSALFAALSALAMMYLVHQFPLIATPTPPLLALFTAWTLRNKEARLLLFFAIPMTAKWLFAVVVATIFLVNLSQLNWVFLALYMGSVIFGYLYAVLVFEFEGFWKLSKNSKGGKIFDIKTGEKVQSDDEFIDAMLAKISRKGEGSLTRAERKRMEEISEKKRKSK